MAIYKALRKDLGTGSITGSSQESYVVPYYIFTDNHESPKTIYNQAKSTTGIMLSEFKPVTSGSNVKMNLVDTTDKLPAYGTVDDNVYVSNINIERASENNLSAVASYGLTVDKLLRISGAGSSYTCWLYTVTFSCSEITISTAEAPWNSDKATSCSLSPKTYERYDNKTLIPNYIASKKDLKTLEDINASLTANTLDDTPVPNYPVTKSKYQNLRNTVGDDLYRNRMVFNYLLNFSYAVRRFDAEWLAEYMNTMNLEECVICGIPVPKYHAVINELRAEQAEWNGKTYFNVNVEVELQYQQNLVYDELVSSGHRAFMLEGSETAINNYLNSLKQGLTKEKAGFVYKYTSADTVKKYPVPIEELTDTKQRDKIPLRRWFMKKKNLGYFEGITKVHEDTEKVSVTRKIFLIYSSLGEDTISICYINPSNFSGEVPYELKETLYYTGTHTDSAYMYSTKQGEVVENEVLDNSEMPKVSGNLRLITVTEANANDSSNSGVFHNEYYITKEVEKHSVSKKPVDPFQGQYNTIQSPLALNKFGGVYFAENETNTIDDETTPGKIDMYDPMLGKVKDYQHVARDWTALGFPTKGLFWGSTANNNTDAMNKVSKYFK